MFFWDRCDTEFGWCFRKFCKSSWLIIGLNICLKESSSVKIVLHMWGDQLLTVRLKKVSRINAVANGIAHRLKFAIFALQFALVLHHICSNKVCNLVVA